MGTEQPDNPTRIPIPEPESPTNSFIPHNRCCFHFHFPCFGSPPTTTTTTTPTISTATSPSPPLWDRLWGRPLWAIKKLRHWSEIIAGPKWKTFLRRFNRHHNHHGGKFQYDPLSYALNFDDGPGQNGHFDDQLGYFPDFTSRFVAAKSSVDLCKGGAAPAG